jgi:putative iron-regulated protein
MRIRRSVVLLAPALAAGALGCAIDDQTDRGPAIRRYAALVHQSYQDSLQRAEALKLAIDSFVAAPSAASLEAARTAWKASREPYLQTEVYRFYGGPIDDEDGPEGQINAWPLNEAHIDYTMREPEAGIINEPAMFPTIDKALIIKQNGLGAEDNVASGYHAVEFLLWGQDLSPTGPGSRPHTDYLVSGGTARNQARRAAYLKAATELLVDDLRGLVAEWTPGQSNYGSMMVQADTNEGLTRIMNGMYRLAALEMKGERLQTGYDEKTQEQEHSCFSDTTKVDFQMNILGVENVYLGRYGGTDGPGVDQLVRAKDAALDAEIKAKLLASKTAIDALPTPFDQVIEGPDGPERARVKVAIDSLQTLGVALLKAAMALGVQLDTSEL